MDLEAIVAAVAPKVWETVERHLKRSLSNEEKILVLAIGSARQPYIWLVKTLATGAYVQAGETKFFEADDPSYAAAYRDAFCSLIEKGLLEPFGDKGAYQLSKKGYEAYSKAVSREP